MRAFDHVSASQIETFSLCERKWFFKSIMGLPTPENAAAALGKEVHDSIERYLLGEIPASELHPLARRVYERRHMPDPAYHTGTYTVEQAIDGMTIEGMPVEGYIDLLEDNLITDWKTRGDPVRYSKTEDQLYDDVQLAIYAQYALNRAPSADSIRVQHVNIGTKPPNAITVSGPVVLDRPTIARTFETKIKPAVRRMREVALLPSPMRVTGNVRACNAYGGCPFRDKCGAADKVASISITPTQGATSMSATDNKGSIMARLRSDSASAPAPAANPNPVRPPDAPASGAKAALLARLNGAKGADVTKPDAPAPEQPNAPASAPEARSSGEARKPRGFAEKLAALGYDDKQIGRMTPATMHEAIDGKINARDVSISKDGALVKIERAPVLAAKGDVDAPDLTDLDSCVKFAIEGLGWGDDEIDNMQDEMLVFVAEKRIARGTVDLTMGDDGKIADLEERAPAPAPSRPAETAPEPGPMIQAPARGLVLYIGCRPVKGPHVAAARPLADLVAELGALVAKDAKIEHYGLIEYNDGAKRIAALLTREPPKGVFVVDRGLATTPHALEALLPFADVVITAGV
jgi:hypothetical protein